MQIPASVPLTYRSGFRSFVSDLQDGKNKYFLRFLCLLLFECTFTSVFKRQKVIKTLQKRYKTVEIKVFSYCFCLIMEGSGSTTLELGGLRVAEHPQKRLKGLNIQKLKFRKNLKIQKKSFPIPKRECIVAANMKKWRVVHLHGIKYYALKCTYTSHASYSVDA